MRVAALTCARKGHRQSRSARLTDAGVDQFRGQQHVGIKAEIGECRIDERLGELARSEVDQGGLEERARAQHLAERHRIAPKQVEGPLQFLFPVVQDAQHPVELVDGGFELRAVVVDEAGDLL